MIEFSKRRLCEQWLNQKMQTCQNFLDFFLKGAMVRKGKFRSVLPRGEYKQGILAELGTYCAGLYCRHNSLSQRCLKSGDQSPGDHLTVASVERFTVAR
jgi:hypothetical protein